VPGTGPPTTPPTFTSNLPHSRSTRRKVVNCVIFTTLICGSGTTGPIGDTHCGRAATQGRESELPERAVTQEAQEGRTGERAPVPVRGWRRRRPHRTGAGVSPHTRRQSVASSRTGWCIADGGSGQAGQCGRLTPPAMGRQGRWGSRDWSRQSGARRGVHSGHGTGRAGRRRKSSSSPRTSSTGQSSPVPMWRWRSPQGASSGQP
jgi:hypothetical protein